MLMSCALREWYGKLQIGMVDALSSSIDMISHLFNSSFMSSHLNPINLVSYINLGDQYVRKKSMDIIN